MEYTDKTKCDPEHPMILKYEFEKPERLRVQSDGGGMLGSMPMPPSNMEIYDGAENGETMDYPAEGICAAFKNVVLVTRRCFEAFCSGNNAKCPRYQKATKSST